MQAAKMMLTLGCLLVCGVLGEDARSILTSVQLFDSSLSSGQWLGPLKSVLEYRLLGVVNFKASVRDEELETIDRVDFVLAGENYIWTHTEKKAPFALFGDDDGVYMPPESPLPADTDMELTVTARDADGAVVDALTRAFRTEGPAVGEMKLWHRIQLSFLGPSTCENADPNPFSDYRFEVAFAHRESGETLRAPGFFAADGDAANTGATCGHWWRVYFLPTHVGVWDYETSFRAGTDVSIELDPEAGEDMAEYSGETGSLRVADTDKVGDDFRARGLLEYVGEHYLRFKGTGEYFLKGGVNSPENMLAYSDFDGTHDRGRKPTDDTNFLYDWAHHVQDWTDGDPTWGLDQRGKGLVGVMNYLASEKINSFYAITYNLQGGDGADVWPHLSPAKTDRDRFDVSKLAQWDIVLYHANTKGLLFHWLTQEEEHDEYLGGSAWLNRRRKLYYRELLAHFCALPGLHINLGEENDNTGHQLKLFSTYIRALDPYRHSLAVHTWYNAASVPWFNKGLTYDKVIETDNTMIDATSFQGDATFYNEWAIEFRTLSSHLGHKWVAFGDEQGPGLVAGPVPTDTIDQLRRDCLWGNLMGGGAGVEYYYGFGYDLRMENFRDAETVWRQAWYARKFFRDYVPAFHAMEPMNHLADTKDGLVRVFAKPGETYVVQFVNSTNGGLVDLTDASPDDEFNMRWYDPRAGRLTPVWKTRSGGDWQKAPYYCPDCTNNPEAFYWDWILLVTKAS